VIGPTSATSSHIITITDAADEVRALFDRVRPTLPIVLANLVSLGEIAVACQPSLEQLIVLLPQRHCCQSDGRRAQAQHQAGLRGRHADPQPESEHSAHNRLPARAATAATHLPGLPRPAAGRCVLPNSAGRAVQRPRNLPCETVPGKRAPTAKLCESNEYYVPLNDGFNWKGDPNATLSGQPIPQLPPGSPPARAAPPPDAAPPPIAAAEYDPATGTYVGPDGRVYTQSNLARSATEEQTWQTMVLPPTGN
jgi:phospholipid/cholesterol/gamma-HCH transport system substrate-binding protein